MTRAKAIARAKEMKCAIRDGGNTISLDPPPGFMLACEAHSMTWSKSEWTMPQIWADLLRELEDDLVPCHDPECDCCLREIVTEDELDRLYGARIT